MIDICVSSFTMSLSCQGQHEQQEKDICEISFDDINYFMTSSKNNQQLVWELYHPPPPSLPQPPQKKSTEVLGGLFILTPG